MSEELIRAIRAAIDVEEQLAQRTLNGPFEGMRAGVFTDHHESPPTQGTIVRVSILPMSWGEFPNSPIYIAYDAAVVLRRVAADRKLLDLHGIIWRNVSWLEREEHGFSEEGAELPVCELCVPRHSHFSTRADVPEGACATVRVIAESYGIEEPT